MQIGGVGWIAGPACLVPRRSVRYAAPVGETRRWRCSPLWRGVRAFQPRRLHHPGLQIQGYEVADPLPPQAPLTAEGRRAVATTLAELDSLALG